MSVYMIVDVKEVMNQQGYGEYIRQVPPIVEKFGGRYLARGGQATAVSGNWKPTRIIIVQFESMDKFQKWWNSPEYRAVAPLRERSAKTDVVVLEGI